MEERRSAQRAAIEVKLTCRLPARPQSATLRDISYHGCRIDVPGAPIEVGGTALLEPKEINDELSWVVSVLCNEFPPDRDRFTTARGTEVVVADVVRSGAYGLQVVIRHGDGLSTSYGHLAEATVDVGDRVDQAGIIGAVGSTGLSTGCHVHFGVRRADQPVDPFTLL